MPQKLAAHHGPEVRPLALRACRRVDPHQPAASLNVPPECLTLRVVLEGLVVAVGEDKRPVLLQVRIGEDHGVVGDVHGKAVLGAHLADGIHAALYVVVHVARAFGYEVPRVDQDLPLGGEAGGRRQQDQGNKPSRHNSYSKDFPAACRPRDRPSGR